jgi:hypothetical protein
MRHSGSARPRVPALAHSGGASRHGIAGAVVSTGSRANGLREHDDLEATNLGAARLRVAVAFVERLGRGLADCRVETKRLVAELAGAILESKKDLTAEPASPSLSLLVHERAYAPRWCTRSHPRTSACHDRSVRSR